MYKFLLETPLGKHWEKMGLERKAGVIFPLFSIFSKQSVGIGEIPDLKFAVDWCNITGHKILQTLPLNDTGFLASPFSPQSSIALNPIYLSLSHLKGMKIPKKEIDSLRDKFPIKNNLVDYSLGKEKIVLLKKYFKKEPANVEFKKFVKENDYWIYDFSLFKAFKTYHGEKSWKKWKKPYKEKNKKALEEFEKENKKEIIFWQWIQWQLFCQLKEIKNYAFQKNILLKGDFPFFVSDDSVDCWIHSKYFKLNLSSGAPPDAFSKDGQSWGMPPYDWDEILKDNFSYFKNKLRYAENFYQIFRIDHVIGFFRIWSISKDKKRFEPQKEALQIQRGKEILKLIIENTSMLPCAEDLGTIPIFCRKTIKDLGIPGLDVARNQKRYRKLAVSTLSTHDLNLYPAWLIKKIKINQESIEKNLKKISSSPAIFNILLIFEWLFLEGVIKKDDAFSYRINNPTESSEKNWSVRMPLSMENLINHSVNMKIKKINQKGSRL